MLGSPTAGLLSIRSQTVNSAGEAVDTVQWTASNFSAAITVFTSLEAPALYTSGHAFSFINGNFYTGVGNSVASPLNWIPMTYAIPPGGASVWAVAVDETDRAHWGYVKLR